MEELLGKLKDTFIKKEDESLNWGAVGIGALVAAVGGVLGSLFSGGGIIATIVGVVLGAAGGSWLSGEVFNKDEAKGIKLVKPTTTPGKTVSIGVNGQNVDIHVPESSIESPWTNALPDTYLRQLNRDAFNAVRLSAKQTSFDYLSTDIYKKSEKFYSYIGAIEDFSKKNQAAPNFPKLAPLQLPADIEQRTKKILEILPDKWAKMSVAEKLAKADYAINSELAKVYQSTEALRDATREEKGTFDSFGNFFHKVALVTHKDYVKGSALARDHTEKFIDQMRSDGTLGTRSSVSDDEFREQMMQVASKLETKATKTDDFKSADKRLEDARFIREQAETLISFRQLLRDRETLLETQINVANSASKWNDEFKSYLANAQPAKDTTSPATDPASIQAAAERAGTTPTTRFEAADVVYAGGAPASTPARTTQPGQAQPANPFTAVGGTGLGGTA